MSTIDEFSAVAVAAHHLPKAPCGIVEQQYIEQWLLVACSIRWVVVCGSFEAWNRSLHTEVLRESSSSLLSETL